MSKHSLYISNSNKAVTFIAKLIIFVLLAAIYVFFIVMPQYLEFNNASLLDKVERLESIEGPKLVLIGNSNLAYGIDSALLEEQIGMPVVNMGLHGTLGNRFHEDMAKYNVTPGDIYVVSHTHFDKANSYGDAVVVWATIENHFKLWKLIRPDWTWKMAKAFPPYLKKITQRQFMDESKKDDGIYSRKYYNEYGDNFLPREGGFYPSEEVKPSEIHEDAIDSLNGLNKYLKENGATMLLAGYPIANGDMTANAKEYANQQKQIEKLIDAPVISDFTEYMYDYSLFFDTEYHLTLEGAELRTNQLIKDIRAWQKFEK